MCQRMVIVADGHDLTVLVAGLINAGVSPKAIHLSKDALTKNALTALGAVCDLPAGRLQFSSEHTSVRNPSDWLIP